MPYITLQKLGELRAKGKKPGTMVVVSEVYLDTPNLFIRIDPEKRANDYDFTPLAGLAVEIVTDGGPERSLELVRAVLRAKPWYLRLCWPSVDFLLRVFCHDRVDVRPESPWVCP